MDGFEIRYRHRSTIYEIEVRRRVGNQAAMELDSAPVENGTVKLTDDGRIHKITLWIPRKTSGTPATIERYHRG